MKSLLSAPSNRTRAAISSGLVIVAALFIGCRPIVPEPTPLHPQCSPVKKSSPSGNAIKIEPSPPAPQLVDVDGGLRDGEEKRKFVALLRETLTALETGKAKYRSQKQRAVISSLIQELNSPQRDFQQTFSKVFFLERPQIPLFTGYYRPLFKGSLKRTKRFSAPLYGYPRNFEGKPPARAELISSGILHSSELVFLKDPFEAYLAQIQGSVGILLEEGGMLALAFAGSNDKPYVSIGSELVKDERLTKEGATIPGIRGFFAKHPEEMQKYINRNPRFIFFKKSKNQVLGSLGVNLLAERSVAADANHYPPGTVLLMRTMVPCKTAEGNWGERELQKLVIVLDTGSAIKGKNRIDLYLGEGEGPGEVAGRLRSRGTISVVGVL